MQGSVAAFFRLALTSFVEGDRPLRDASQPASTGPGERSLAVIQQHLDGAETRGQNASLTNIVQTST